MEYELKGGVEMSAQCVSAIWTLSTLVRTLHRLGRLICMAQADQFEAPFTVPAHPASIDLNYYAEHILIRSCHLNVNVQDDGV